MLVQRIFTVKHSLQCTLLSYWQLTPALKGTMMLEQQMIQGEIGELLRIRSTIKRLYTRPQAM